MPTLRDVFTPLIAYGLFLMTAPAELSRPFAEIRRDMERLLEQQRAAVKRHDIAPQDYQSASFAVIAWVDEAVMRCSHDVNPELFAQWRHAPLQVELFNTANAGEEFFERLGRLTPSQKQVIELYHLALCLGFRGRYYDPGQDAQLIELRRQYAAHLPVPLLEPLEFEQRQDYVTPEPYAVAPPHAQPPATGFSPYWLALPVLAAAVLLLYFLWPAGPNPRAIENAVRGFDCADITVADIERGQVTLTGHLTDDNERNEVLQRVRSVRGVKGISDKLAAIPRPFCEVMEVLAPIVSGSARQTTDLSIKPAKGCDGTYNRGENLEVDVTANKPLHYVYVDYYVADRQIVVHLLPNPQERDNSLGDSPRLSIGAPDDKAQWQIQPPFGREMVTVVTSPKPLFAQPRLAPETANDYLVALREALRAEQPNPALAAAYCFTISTDR